jgi:hypothetical protein
LASMWTEEELRDARKIDLEVAKLVSEYLGGAWHKDTLFVPSAENLARFRGEVAAKKGEVARIADAFWRDHFTAVLESLEFSIECNSKMPYEYITRLSASFDSLTRAFDPRPKQERAALLASRLAKAPAVLAGVKGILERCTDLGRSQVADLLPPTFGNIAKVVAFIKEHGDSEGMKSDAEKNGAMATAAAHEIEGMVKSLPLATLQPVDIPFDFSVEKGMQAPLDYILSWYQDDVEMRKKEFFKVAKEIDPSRDAYDLLNNGTPGYSTADEIYADMRRILKDVRTASLNFIDLPDDEMCDVGDIPETWRMVCPTFMYMGGVVCINPENIPAFTRAMIEETLAHEVYPGHHAHGVKSGQSQLPNTFKLGLFMSRSLDEGLAHRSEYLMMPYFKDPVSRLEAAKRGWYCSTRVKVEVDLYYHRKPVQEVIDNYITNLNCTEYSAVAQTRAHMMRPADGISYYTGMRFIEELYRKSGREMKEFTNETFSYGHVALGTLENILALTPEKKAQLRAFNPLKG